MILGNAGRRRGRGRDLAAREHDQLRRGATRQHLVQRIRLAPVDGECVSLPDRNHSDREPAAILRRLPLGRVGVDLLVAIHARAGQRQVQQVGREAATGRNVRGAQADPTIGCSSWPSSLDYEVTHADLGLWLPPR